jgi:hypothetical protein
VTSAARAIVSPMCSWPGSSKAHRGFIGVVNHVLLPWQKSVTLYCGATDCVDPDTDYLPKHLLQLYRKRPVLPLPLSQLSLNDA